MAENFFVYGGKIELLGKSPRPSEDPFWLAHIAHSWIDPESTPNLHIADIGTGSGIIPLLIHQHFPEAGISGVDIEESLIQTAQENATINHASGLEFAQHNILEKPLQTPCHYVLSNPPYHNTNKGFTAKDKDKKKAHGNTEKEMQKWLENSLASTKETGFFIFIHHSQNMSWIKELFKDYKTHLYHLKTHASRPAKKVVIVLQKTNGSWVEEMLDTTNHALREAVLGA